MIALYAEAAEQAERTTTWRLVRLERRARRAGAGQLGAPGLHRWAAARAELHRRGLRLPTASDRSGRARRSWGRR